MSRRRQDHGAAPAARLSLGRRLAVMAASGLATLAIAVLVVTAWGFWSFNSPGPQARQGAQTSVVLRRGASLPEIAADLEDQGVVRSASIFIAAAELTGGTRRLKAGEYAFPSRASLGQILSMIRRGQIVRHFVTIPEGVSSAQVTDILMKNDVLSGSAPVPPEGSILPETYEVARGEDRASVLQRMMADRDRLLADLWPKRRAGLPFQSPEDAVVMASIVEKETGKASERPRVAAVFINRLRKGMRLESDPTVIYGLAKGEPLGRSLRQADLADPSPYNTYQVAGLPPTPICNPGRAAIAAVLDPPDTSELYFVADGTGGHAFSSTLEEHERNVQHWRQIEHGGAPPQPGAPKAAGESGGKDHDR